MSHSLQVLIILKTAAGARRRLRPVQTEDFLSEDSLTETMKIVDRTMVPLFTKIMRTAVYEIWHNLRFHGEGVYKCYIFIFLFF